MTWQGVFSTENMCFGCIFLRKFYAKLAFSKKENNKKRYDNYDNAVKA